MRVRALAVVVCLWCAPAWAVTQPNGVTIPTGMGCNAGQPTGLPAVFACACTQPGVCNIGAVCPNQQTCDNGQHGTCETTIWHSFNDNTCIPSNMSGLNPVTDASTMPETFRPSCPLTFTILTRGTARFHNVFGWYNVGNSAPQPGDLHVMIDCNAQSGSQVVLDVRNDPAYTGGDIGFFLVTPESHTQTGACANGDCCATPARVAAGQGYAYFSQSQWNPDHVGANSYIHLLVYDSRVTPRKFYFAWEDIYGGSDNEFTDLVTSVEGVECAGGGAQCDTGRPGICSYGVTECRDGMLGCTELFPPAPEVCNGLDDDCNGLIDDGAMCGPNQVCQDGHCVAHCGLDPEFACPPNLACDPHTGFCVPQACLGGGCPAPSCDGVVCPHGQVCRFGGCSDPCHSVNCPQGQVCSQGLCVPGCSQCGGLVCASGETCDPNTNTCADLSCSTPCPAGTFCSQGTCHDSCEGAHCPAGLSCSQGMCVGGNTGGSGGGSGGSSGSPDGGAGNGVNGPDAGCGCGFGPTPYSRSLPLLMVLFALAIRGARNRRR